MYFAHCRVFANAETLFYYARQGRPSRRTLSQLEIQSLLAQTNLISSLTIVSPSEKSDSFVSVKAEIIHDSTSSEKQALSSKTSSKNRHKERMSADFANESELTDQQNPLSPCGQDDVTPVLPFDETDFETQIQLSTTNQNQPSTSGSAEVSKSPVHPFGTSDSLPHGPNSEDPSSTFARTSNHQSHSDDTAYQEGRRPSKASTGVWEVSDMDVTSPTLGWQLETGQAVEAEEEAVESTLTATGEILGHTHDEGDGCRACLQEKDRIAVS